MSGEVGLVRLLALLIMLCALPLPARCAETTPPLAHREHPFLFGDKALLQQAKERAKSHDWARKQLEEIVKDADAVVAKPLEVPDKEGQWGHHYVCKVCSTRLETKGTRHVCPN